MSERPALICGFWDEPAELAGVAWELGTSGGLLWRDGEVRAASAELEDRGDSVRLRLDARGEACEAELSIQPDEVALASGSKEAMAARCVAAVSVGGGNGRTLQAPGQLTRWRQSPTEGAGVLRHLVVPAAEGAVLVVLATGASGAPHNEEIASALLLGPEGVATAYPEALLSTQYDDGGLQSRAGLELWSEDEEAPPMRAAGTRLGQVPGPRDGVTAALLRSSAGRIEGLGSYLIWRG